MTITNNRVIVPDVPPLEREMIALRIANMLEDGSYVNLGIGIPTLVSNWIEGRDIIFNLRSACLNAGH